MISVITPVYCESRPTIDSLITHLLGFSGFKQIIFVATEHDPNLEQLNEAFKYQQPNKLRLKLLIIDKAGRAQQMNAGASHADNEILCFVHADTRLPDDADQLILNAMSGSQWGRFDIQLDDSSLIFKVIAWFINLRSRITGISTGDQAQFVKSSLFKELHGFPDQRLMEDVEFSIRAKRHHPPVSIRQKLTTSARRWKANGVFKTVLLMWWLRLRYFFGTSPEVLARLYRQAR